MIMKKTCWILLLAAAALGPAGSAHAYAGNPDLLNELFWADERILVFVDRDGLCYSVGELAQLGLSNIPRFYATARPPQPQEEGLFEQNPFGLATAQPSAEPGFMSHELDLDKSWDLWNADPGISVPATLAKPVFSEQSQEPAEVTLVPEPSVSLLSLSAAAIGAFGLMGNRRRKT